MEDQEEVVVAQVAADKETMEVILHQKEMMVAVELTKVELAAAEAAAELAETQVKQQADLAEQDQLLQ
jgi:hypothetical protein